MGTKSGAISCRLGFIAGLLVLFFAGDIDAGEATEDFDGLDGVNLTSTGDEDVTLLEGSWYFME